MEDHHASTDGVAAVRNAAHHDVDALARVHVASWRAAYHRLLPQPLIDARSYALRRRQWRSLLAQPEGETLVLEVDGEVLGFCNFGPARDADLPTAVAEVYALYLDPEVWRCGFGGRLWRESVSRLRSRGYREVAVWLLEGNARARGFYRSRGLEADGWRRAEADRGEYVEQIRLRGPLDSQA